MVSLNRSLLFFFFPSLFSTGSPRQFFLLGKCFLPCRVWESNSFGHVVPLSSIPTLSPPWAGGSRKDVWEGRSVLIHLDQSLQNLSFQSHDSSYHQWKLGIGSSGCPGRRQGLFPAGQLVLRTQHSPVRKIPRQVPVALRWDVYTRQQRHIQ